MSQPQPPTPGEPARRTRAAGSRSPLSHVFDKFAAAITHRSGSPLAFALAVAAVVLWAACGPLFDYSETWQLVINTGTSIVTFLMVFLIQQSQNRDSAAVHLKLNELLASHHAASNALVSIEDLDETELQELRAFYRRLAELSNREDISQAHSQSVAERIQLRKEAIRAQVVAERKKELKHAKHAKALPTSTKSPLTTSSYKARGHRETGDTLAVQPALHGHRGDFRPLYVPLTQGDVYLPITENSEQEAESHSGNNCRAIYFAW